MDNQEGCTIRRWELLKKLLQNLNGEQFQEMRKQYPDAVLLDVRTDAEFAGGSLPKAIHLNYFADDFIDRLEKMDPQQCYLLFCRTGRRSVRVGTLMRNLGFKNVFNLDGGMRAWTNIPEFGTLVPA
ncbi:MAG: rhodanese-like domain-containing protein [Lewinellaceae bacterium]|nr:rhodanese-like domain-containing protein [Lewinellaceae bacterium]